MRKAVLTWGLAFCASASLSLLSTTAKADGTPAPAPDATSPAPTTATPAATTPATTAPTPGGDANGAPSGGWVTLHVDSPTPVSIEKRAGATAAWEHVCESPCDQHVPVDAEYRVTGTDVNESNEFQLHPRGDTATVKVTPGSPGKARTGWIILGTAGAVGIAGIIIDGVAAGKDSTVPGATGTTTDNSRTDLYFVGTTLLIVGALGSIYGASWVIDNRHSKVEGAVMEAPPAHGSNDPVTHVAQSAFSSVPTFFMPLVTARF
jgi:hypothetical protein